ncbi:MAG: AAA family ATPase [Myxococcales bacterium]|nr:AAA family ATPase [Myxococcales bacterium]
MFAGLEIDGFRLDGLGRVNLIMGKNNSGKTSLLEAINLLGNQQMIQGLPGLFRANTGPVAELFFPWLVRDGCASTSLAALQTSVRAASFWPRRRPRSRA